jgi:hypothetical protein
VDSLKGRERISRSVKEFETWELFEFESYSLRPSYNAIAWWNRGRGGKLVIGRMRCVLSGGLVAM